MGWLQNLDSGLLFLIQDHLVTPLLNPIMLFFSTIGNVGAVWLVLGMALLFVKKYRRVGIAVLLAVALCFVLGNISLKPLFARPRPCWLYPEVPLLLPNPTDFSFPSGHTMGSFGAAGALLGMKHKLALPALALAAMIGFSRLYLFVHFPSDVLAGAVLGLMLGVLSAWMVQQIRDKRLA